MNAERIQLSETVDRRTVRTVSKLLLNAGASVFVLGLVSVVPGVGRLASQTPVTFQAVVAAVAAAVAAGVLVYLAPLFASLTRNALQGPTQVVDDVASVVHWVAVFAAVVVAHAGFAGVAAQLVADALWLYDLAFLLLALPVVAVVATRLYVTLGPGADVLADRFVGTEQRENGSARGDRDAN